LDGFPRTIGQASSLDKALAARGQRISAVLSIMVPDEALAERLGGRWLCRTCGEAYHTVFSPPRRAGVCDRDGGELYQRDDDKVETIRNRLKVYWTQTSPLIEYYTRQGVLVEVNGDQPMDQVEADLKAAAADGQG
jgi:adenylate kinase